MGGEKILGSFRLRESLNSYKIERMGGSCLNFDQKVLEN